MKNWLAATLFPREGDFPWRVGLVLGVITLTTGGVAGATEYSAASSCGTTPGVFGSPVPVTVVASGNGTDGAAVAGSPLKFEVHTTAAAPNVPANNFRDCGATAAADYTDVIVQGPAPTVLALVHVPFHANITQDFAEMSDGSSTIWSSSSANLQLIATISGGAAFAHGGLEIQLNRQAKLAAVLQTAATNTKFVPKPRIPGLIPLDADGFITRFFQVSLPVTAGSSAQSFAGFDTYTIDEVRGEMVMTLPLPTNQALTLALNATIRDTSTANFFARAFGSISEGRLSVPTDGSVTFELPEGFTADIPSAGVIDNVVPQIFTCTRTVTDWRNHPEAWPLTSMTLGSQTYAQNELLAILQMVVTALRPDASVTLAQQLIAARLNEANDAAPGPMLQPSMVADALLAGFRGNLPYRVLPNTATGQQMTNVGLQLSRYNTGQLTSVCVP